MSYLRTFAPWILYAIIPSAHWNWAALIALVLSIGLIAQQTWTGRTVDAQIIELGSAVFFAAITVVAFTTPDSGLHAYTPALSSATLALIAGASLAVRKPFTLGIAKQTTPREFWDQPLFVRTNVIITAVWTASFAVAAVVLTTLAHSGSTTRTVVQVAGFVVPMVFTLRYVAHIQTRAAQIRTR